MSLRKRLTSFHFQRGKVSASTSLRDWLLGTGVAAACLTPIGAASSLSGGIPPLSCISSGPELCTDSAGNVCPYVDEYGFYMTEACTLDFGVSDAEIIDGNLLCPEECFVPNGTRGSGAECSEENTCYY
jgi:hypothetical protein